MPLCSKITIASSSPTARTHLCGARERMGGRPFRGDWRFWATCRRNLSLTVVRVYRRRSNVRGLTECLHLRHHAVRVCFHRVGILTPAQIGPQGTVRVISVRSSMDFAPFCSSEEASCIRRELPARASMCPSWSAVGLPPSCFTA